MTSSTESTTGADTMYPFEQFKDAGEQLITAARKAGNLYLDRYEKALDQAIRVEVKLAGLSRPEWLKSLIEDQAELSRQVASLYASTARALLK
jgi:hypothetical protein